jgi:hypothetical protein
MIALLLSGVLMASTPSCTPSESSQERVDLNRSDILPFAIIGTFTGLGIILLIQNQD